MDIFEEKSVMPMLISQMSAPFNDPAWIYELKLDGSRCIAYLDSSGAVLRNKRGLSLENRFPELKGIGEQVRKRCILDGELVVFKNGIPDFYELQRRSMLSGAFKIQLAVSQYPASFVAYDCLYLEDKTVMDRPLWERRQILEKTVRVENSLLAVSRYVEENGIGLYALADERELEGVVAKRKDSLYYMGKRTRDWIKFKRLADEDFIICGYLDKGKGVYSLILAKYGGGELRYKGHVTLGVGAGAVAELRSDERAGKRPEGCPFTVCPAGNEQAVWTSPLRVGVVQYMPNTKNVLRQAVFKGFRDDMLPFQVIDNI